MKFERGETAKTPRKLSVGLVLGEDESDPSEQIETDGVCLN